jgi:hypothetical protein
VTTAFRRVPEPAAKIVPEPYAGIVHDASSALQNHLEPGRVIDSESLPSIADPVQGSEGRSLLIPVASTSQEAAVALAKGILRHCTNENEVKAKIDAGAREFSLQLSTLPGGLHRVLHNLEPRLSPLISRIPSLSIGEKLTLQIQAVEGKQLVVLYLLRNSRPSVFSTLKEGELHPLLQHLWSNLEVSFFERESK